MMKAGERVFAVRFWNGSFSQEPNITHIVTGYWARIQVLSVIKETGKVIGWDVAAEGDIMEPIKQITREANITTTEQMKLLKEHFIVKEGNINDE